MKKMNKWLQRCKAAGKTFLAAFAVFLLNTQTAYASGISESKLAKGTEKLIGDATTWLMVLAPVKLFVIFAVTFNLFPPYT